MSKTFLQCCSFIPMEPQKLPTLTYTLQVNIKCCKECQEKATKRLKKMDGLETVNYDSERGMLTVSGNIDPAILINKFDKWGRKAELYSFQRNSMQIDNRGKCRDCCARKIKDFDCSSGSEDDNKEEKFDVHAPKKCSNKISRQGPSLVKNSTKKESPIKKRSGNKGKKFFGCFGEKDKAAMASSNKNGGENVQQKSLAASKWHFPTTSMPEYGVPGPFVPPPYGDRRLYYMNEFPPMMFQRPMRPYFDYWSMTLPPPYGIFQPRPPARMNPMTHYTSYQDNSFYYP